MRLTQFFATTAALLLAVPLLGCTATLDDLLAYAPQDPSPRSETGIEVAPEITAPDQPELPALDYFTVVGPAERLYAPETAGVVEYCALDHLGRAGCAYGELTTTLRAEARATERQQITEDPAGWNGGNTEVTIPALPGVDGSRDYRGWFWNRSHLVADSLGGDATRENLVTGTRTQNVGSAQVSGQYAGGMARAEVIARDYLDNGSADACPLYYAATPVYAGDELVPRTVLVDLQSCDAEVDLRIEVSNTANGFTIDYATGAFAAAG